MSEVEWKTVEGYSRYKVSTDGEVMDTKDNVLVAKQLTGVPQYYYVNLNADNGYRKLVRVHRLVAQAFIPNPENFNIVDHINRDKLNNKISNLRWTDHSGNQRNVENNKYIGDVLVKDFVNKYESPSAAYSYIMSNLFAGLSEQDAVQKYEEYLQYGIKKYKVEWEGEEVYLSDLCEQMGKDYYSVKNRLGQGWDIWNAIYGINTEFNSKFSFVLRGENEVDHWFPSKEYFGKLHRESLIQYLDMDYTYEELLMLDGKEHLRQTIRGVTGTIKELCKHFQVSESAVNTNMSRRGMTLEDALFAPRKRVKSLSINGVYNTPKYWYESFGINPKTANKIKSVKGLTFKETLEHFGVDTTGMVFSDI